MVFIFLVLAVIAVIALFGYAAWRDEKEKVLKAGKQEEKKIVKRK